MGRYLQKELNKWKKLYSTWDWVKLYMVFKMDLVIMLAVYQLSKLFFFKIYGFYSPKYWHESFVDSKLINFVEIRNPIEKEKAVTKKTPTFF